MLILKRLNIERQTWGADKGKFTGTMSFDGEAGDVGLILSPDQCHRLFLAVADAVIATAKEAATSLVVEAQATVAKEAAPAIGVAP